MKFGHNHKPNFWVNLTHLYVISLKNLLGDYSKYINVLRSTHHI